MTTSSSPCRGCRFPAEVTEHAVWPHHCFSLSLCDVETTLAARGIVLSSESICDRSLRFGRLFANALRRRRPKPTGMWHLNEALRLSANSGGLGQGCEARHACLGAWPFIQPMHHP